MAIRTKSLTGLLGLCCLLAVSVVHVVAAEPANQLRDFGRTQLLVETRGRCILISAYVAHTRQQRAQGLMYVSDMPLEEGMIFLYPEAARISMWMKNTMIPLDMLFLSGDGRVTKIAAHTEPLSEKMIESEADVTAVLELNGGAAEYFGIAPGDVISFFRNPDPG